MTFIDNGNPDIQQTPGRPPRITVRPQGVGGQGVAAPVSQSGDPWADFKPITAAPSAPAAADTWADFSPIDQNGESTAPPKRQVGTGEAVLGGVAEGATFGFAPALEGLATAAGPEYQHQTDPISGQDRPSAAAPIIGAAKLLQGYLSGHPDPSVVEAYNRGRQAALDNEDLAKEQHPEAYLAGQLGGTLMMPLPGAGAMRAGTVGARALAGARAGAVGGGLYGAGEATSQGQGVGGVATGAAEGAGVGAVLGAGLGAAVGPRARPAAPQTPGQQAAQTAEIIGAPLPRGVVSDSPTVQRITASTSSAPYFGARIGGALERNTEAAGNVVAGSGAQDAINANKAAIDSLYNGVRGQIDPDRVMPMPRTAAMVQRVKAERAAAGHSNPGQGLEQFDNLGNQGASFNGAHRARVDAREAGNVATPHPGYNAGDYNRITRAMTADITDNVGKMGGIRAVAAFQKAESDFVPYSKANAFLAKLTNKDPAATLAELGYNNSTGHFSLDKFITELNKIRDPRVRALVPTPQHRAAIEAVFEMGSQIKRVMGTRNTSHTSNAIILYDLAQDAVLTGVGIATGMVSAGGVAGAAAGGAPVLLFMRWLSSPSTAMTMGRWSRAYQAVLGTPTPARIAAFNLATRNLANTLGVPVERLLQIVQRRLPGAAENQSLDQQQRPGK